MSDEPSSSTKEISEHAAEVQKEESQLEAGTEAVVEQPQDNVQDRPESAGSNASDVSIIPDPNTQPQQNPPKDASGILDSQESHASSGGISTGSQQTSATSRSNGTDSEQSWATCDGSGMESQKSCINKQLSLDNSDSNSVSGLESMQGRDRQLSLDNSDSNGVSGLESVQSRDSISESLEDGATCGGTGTESKQGSIIGAIGGEISQESTAYLGGGGGGTESVQSGGTEQQLPNAVDGASRRNSQISFATASLCSGDSQETALVCDSSSRHSQENGIAADVSNSPDSQEDPSNGVAAAGLLTRREFRENEEETASGNRYFSTCDCVCKYLIPCSRRIRKSKIFLFFRLFLLIIPVSAFCIGWKYLHLCPVNKDLPITVLLLGLIGFVLIVSSLALSTRHMLCPNLNELTFTTVITISRGMFAVLFAVCMYSMENLAPGFDSSDPSKYCNSVFYHYTYYMNWIVVGLIILILSICIPTFNENIEGYERL